MIVSLAPDVCRSPTLPVPYPIVDFCGHDGNYTKSVRFTSEKAMVMRSSTTHAHGDEPGIGKGVKSGTVGDICEPIGHASQVRAEGSCVIRHLDRFHMNCRNTVGEACFVRDVRSYEAPVDDDKIPGSLKWPDKPVQLAFDGTDWQKFLPPQTEPAPAKPQTATPEPEPKKGQKRTGKFGKPVGGLAGPAMVMDGLADSTLPGTRLWRLQRGLAGEGIVIDLDDPGELSALRNYSENLGGRSFLRRNLYPPMTEPEARIQLQKELKEARAKTQKEEEDKKPKPLVETDNARVDRKKPDCLVGEYGKIDKTCTSQGGKTHHVVPDMVYRLGDRKGKVTTDRVPNAPTEDEGESICITGAQHSSKGGSGGVHENLRSGFSGIDHPNFPGTAPMGKILRSSQAALLATPGVPPECAALANANAERQVRSKTGMDAPGRTRERPLPSGDAERVLRAGNYGS